MDSARRTALAEALLGERQPLEVLESAVGFYIGTQTSNGEPGNRESQEYWPTKDEAEQALNNGLWTQDGQDIVNRAANLVRGVLSDAEQQQGGGAPQTVFISDPPPSERAVDSWAANIRDLTNDTTGQLSARHEARRAESIVAEQLGASARLYTAKANSVNIGRIIGATDTLVSTEFSAVMSRLSNAVEFVSPRRHQFIHFIAWVPGEFTHLKPADKL